MARKESEKLNMKLRLVEAPHKRSILEKDMRYDLILGDKLVGEAYFNTRGYNVIKRPGELQGFVSGEHSLPALRKEIAYWNKINAMPGRIENSRKAGSMRKRNKTIIKADRIEHLDVARVHNPRYLVSRDGIEVGIFPGFNALMAINAARKIYGAGKYSSVKTGEAMYLGRGALETERREREERTARAAAKAAAKRDKIQLPKKSRTRRNAEGKANILQQGVKAGILPAGLVTDLQRLEEGRFPADPARRANLLQRALKVRNDLVYQNLLEENLLGEAVQRALFDVIAREQRKLRRNPAEKDPEHPTVRQIFEEFNGRPATRATSVSAPRRTPARVAQLGRLRLIRTADGRTWRFPGDRAPFLAADSRGKLHVVGGQYRANPAGEECGEIEQIEYQTSKPHLGHDNETIYYHQLGEETGERPLLEITPEGELQIVGGDYRIEADGIHN